MLSVIIEGSKEFSVGGAHSDYLTIQSNQASSIIDRRGHSDRNISFVSLYSCMEMQSGVFRRNSNDIIGVNPPRTIGRIKPQVTSQCILKNLWLRQGCVRYFQQECVMAWNRVKWKWKSWRQLDFLKGLSRKTIWGWNIGRKKLIFQFTPIRITPTRIKKVLPNCQ